MHSFDLSFAIVAILVVRIVADPNPNISNGTCFYAPGEEAPSRFIPCGNSAVGPTWCCESGDMCLSNRACYNGQCEYPPLQPPVEANSWPDGVTYLAGCTDPFYDDLSCPDKGIYADDAWTGLVYCNGTSNEWTGCQNSPSTVTSAEPCWCPSTSRSALFTYSSQLANIMRLPATTGASVTWAPPFDASFASVFTHSALATGQISPSTASISFQSNSAETTFSSSDQSFATPYTTYIVSSGSFVISTITVFSAVVSSSLYGPWSMLIRKQNPSSANSPTSTTVTPSNSSSPTITTLVPQIPAAASSAITGLGMRAKVGIGIGAGVVGLTMFGMVLLLIAHRRRKARKSVMAAAEKDRSVSYQPVGTSAEKDSRIDAVDPRSPAWSGHKPELPADSASIVSPVPAYQPFTHPASAEVEGSPSPGGLGWRIRSGVYEMPA